MLTKTLDKMNRGALAHSCIMGNQGKIWREIRRFVLEFKDSCS